MACSRRRKRPPALVTRFQQAVRKALQVPQVHEHFVSNGYDPMGDPPAVWAKAYVADLKRSGKSRRRRRSSPSDTVMK